MTITAGPTGTVNTRDVQFGFSANQSGVTPVCRLAGPGQSNTFAACRKPDSQLYAGLADGAYTFSVRDGAFAERADRVALVHRRRDAAEHDADADRAADQRPTSRPSRSPPTSGRDVPVPLDGARASGLHPPLHAAALARARTPSRSAAVDAAGNVDATPGDADLRPSTRRPRHHAGADSGPTNDTHADLHVHLQGGRGVPVPRRRRRLRDVPRRYTALPLPTGAHTFAVRALDAARQRRRRRRRTQTCTVDTVARHDADADHDADQRPDADVHVLLRGRGDVPVPRRRRRVRGLHLAAHDGGARRRAAHLRGARGRRRRQRRRDRPRRSPSWSTRARPTRRSSPARRARSTTPRRPSRSARTRPGRRSRARSTARSPRRARRRSRRRRWPRARTRSRSGRATRRATWTRRPRRARSPSTSRRRPRPRSSPARRADDRARARVRLRGHRDGHVPARGPGHRATSRPCASPKSFGALAARRLRVRRALGRRRGQRERDPARVHR